MPALSQLFVISPAAGATSANVFSGTVFETLTFDGTFALKLVSDPPTTAGDYATASLSVVTAAGNIQMIQPGSVVPVTRDGIKGSGPDSDNSGLVLPGTRLAAGAKPVLTITNGDTAALGVRILATFQSSAAPGA